MASVTTVVSLIVGSAALATISVTSNFSEHTSPPAVPSFVPEPVAKARVVQVTGEDFKFDAPDVIHAGLTEFRFLNKGPTLHHMSILRLSGGKTVEDLRAALANPGPLPAWAKEMGGPNAPAPGLESNATLKLEPGNYVLICFVDIGGPPHFAKGMMRPLRVVAAKGPSAAKPKADLTVKLVDYTFRLTSPIRAGTRTIRVENAGKQTHEVELVQFAPNETAAGLLKWLEKMEGPPPGKPLGGIAGIEPGMSQSFRADFAPGNYALICFVPDAKDGKPHYAHGMIQQIAVR